MDLQAIGCPHEVPHGYEWHVGAGTSINMSHPRCHGICGRQHTTDAPLMARMLCMQVFVTSKDGTQVPMFITHRT